MTDMLTAPDYRAVTDDDLAGLFASLEDTDGIVSVIAEMDRRERAGRMTPARRALDSVRTDAEAAVHAQFLAASETCRGRLLSRAGTAAGIAERDLWRMPESALQRYASEELRDYFTFTRPRITVTGYVRERAAQGRAERYAALDRNGGNDHDRDPGNRAGLAEHEPGALRRIPAPSEAPQRAGGAVQRGGPAPVAAGGARQDGAAVRGAGGPAQPATGGRDAMTVTGRDSRADGYFTRARARVAADAGGHDAVAVPQGTAVARTDRIDGARLLNIADAWTGRHAWMSDAARHAAVLYVAAQHFRAAETGRMVWPKFGRMLYVASEPGSGKTTAMVLMGYMSAPWFRGIDANPTAPGMCASVKEENAALFIDEMHRLLGAKGTRKADAVTILNVGYEKNGTYLNARGGKANRVPVYAAAVMAGKDVLLTSAAEEIGDLIDRCVAVVRMSKPPPDAELAEITGETEAQGAAIAAGLAAWAAQEMAGAGRFREAFTTACDRAREIGLTGRAKDVWVPLMATAWLASPGHLDAACEAALEFRKNRPAQAEEDPLAGLEAALCGGGGLPSWG